jgi:hypothetical protein
VGPPLQRCRSLGEACIKYRLSLGGRMRWCVRSYGPGLVVDAAPCAVTCAVYCAARRSALRRDVCLSLVSLKFGFVDQSARKSACCHDCESSQLGSPNDMTLLKLLKKRPCFPYFYLTLCQFVS